MRKDQAINIFGNRTVLAKLVGVTNATVTKWPEELPDRVTDRIIGACLRLGIMDGTYHSVEPSLFQHDFAAEIQEILGVGDATIEKWKEGTTQAVEDRVNGALIRVGRFRARYNSITDGFLMGHEIKGLTVGYDCDRPKENSA